MTPNRLLRSLTRVLIVGACLYLTPLLCLGMFQGALMFHPAHYAARDWPVSRLPRGIQRMTLRTRDGDNISALFAPALAAGGQPDTGAWRRPTLLYFHGNGGDLRDTLGEIQEFRRMDFNVMAPDYVGYGLSTAQPSERGCYSAADAAYEALLMRRDIDRSRIVILGHSLGTAVAVDLAARALFARRPVAGLALVSGFTSMSEEGHSRYPLYPAFLLRLAARYPFDTVDKIVRIKCPVFIAHSRSDALIPYEMASRLAAASGGPVTQATLDHVAHGHAFSDGAPQVFPPLRAFVTRVARADGPSGVQSSHGPQSFRASP